MKLDRSPLVTDLYQLTNAQAYWKAGMADIPAAFTLGFRRNPFGGAYSIFAGLQEVVEYINEFHFDHESLDYLMDLEGNDGGPLFLGGFINYLRKMKLSVELESFDEGSVVFPNEPLLRVTGPLAQAQILETAIINKTGFASLVATKASRVVRAANGAGVLEFGLRRAQGMAGLVASRSAYIAGCVGTSNVLAGKEFGIPVKGTHAHSLVMAFPNEIDAFSAYADASPNNLAFLVDTYSTHEGVKNAIRILKTLKSGAPASIRLDSGNLLELSKMSREMLNLSGLHHVKIMASNDLDEYAIAELVKNKAPIDAYGVGTKLATADGDPSFGMVYKLTAIRKSGVWKDRIKLSEDPVKVSTPGILNIRRYCMKDNFTMDVVYDELSGRLSGPVMTRNGDSLDIPDGSLIRNGNCLHPQSRILTEKEATTRARFTCLGELKAVPANILSGAETYPVVYDRQLYKNKVKAIDTVRNMLKEEQAKAS